jgi:hypothetical protein
VTDTGWRARRTRRALLAVTVAVAVAVIVAVMIRSSHSRVAQSAHADETGEVVATAAAFPDPTSVPTTMITDYSEPGIAPDTVSIGWSRNEDLLVVTTFGSGSCPKFIDRVVRGVGNSIHIAIRTEDATVSSSPPGTTRTCTSDLRPLTTTIRAPAGITAQEILVVKLGSREWRVPPRG